MSISPPLDREPADVIESAIAALNTPNAELPISDVERALRHAPHDYRLWHLKGLMYREIDQREHAIPALRHAAELAPNEPLVAHGYARTLLESGLPAVEQFARALKLSPQESDLIKGLASALVAERRIGDAVEGLARVVQRSPLWTEGHKLLARLRWLEGEKTRFTRSFDEALLVHPNSLDLRREQMILLLHANRFDEVLTRVINGRSMFGHHPLFTAFEAVVRSETGDDDAADALFLGLAPLGVANFDMRHVRHLIRSRRPEEAVAVLDRWLGNPDEAMFWPYAHTAWRMTGDDRADWLECHGQLVGFYDLSDQLPALAPLAATLRKLHIFRGQPLAQSVRGGTQTDGHLLQRIEPEIIRLREALRTAVANHAQSLPALEDGHPTSRHRPSCFAFSGAWSVRLSAEGRHANHVHPMGWFSSALYIVLPSENEGGESGWLTLGQPDASLSTPLEPSRTIEPKTGHLALFPSWMWHGTLPFSQGERITVAFDVLGATSPS